MRRMSVLTMILTVVMPLAVVAGSAFPVAVAASPSAANSVITWPFDLSQGPWEIYHGYNVNPDHHGYQIDSLDFTQQSSYDDTANKKVISPVTGTLIDFGPAYDDTGQCVRISIDQHAAYFVMLCHLNYTTTVASTLRSNGSIHVTKGETQIGTVYNDSNSGDHIHMTLFRSLDGNNNRQPIAFSLSNSSDWRIDGCNFPATAGQVNQYGEVGASASNNWTPPQGIYGHGTHVPCYTDSTVFVSSQEFQTQGGTSFRTSRLFEETPQEDTLVSNLVTGPNTPGDPWDQVHNIFDLARSSQGDLYANTGSMLYKVDPSTALLTPRDNPFGAGIDTVVGLAFNGLNVLYGVTSDGTLLTINPSTGVATTVGAMVDLSDPGSPFYASGDLVFGPDGKLYATGVFGGSKHDVLVTINPLTAQFQRVGSVSDTGFSGILGLYFIGRQLYGVTGSDQSCSDGSDGALILLSTEAQPGSALSGVGAGQRQRCLSFDAGGAAAESVIPLPNHVTAPVRNQLQNIVNCILGVFSFHFAACSKVY